MYIEDGKASTTNKVTVEATHKAARMTLRPPEIQGAYRVSQRSGSIVASTASGTAGTNCQYDFRYAGTGVCAINSIRLSFNTTTAYSSNTSIAFLLYVIRGFTTNYSIGGTLSTETGLQGKLRVSMSNHQTQSYITTTGLQTGGVGSWDLQAIGVCHFTLPNIITQQPTQEIYGSQSGFITPLILTLNEGFALVNSTTYPTVGVSRLTVMIEWFEFAAVSTDFY